MEHAQFVIIQSASDCKLVIIPPLFCLIYNHQWRTQWLCLALPLVGWIEPSLKICIYMIRLSGLLDLDIYFPLKVMFDYALIKNRKTTELVGDWLILSSGFFGIWCNEMHKTKHEEAPIRDSSRRTVHNVILSIQQN